MLFINMSLFCRRIPHRTFHNRKFWKHASNVAWFLLHLINNTNRCICYIINERPILYWFMKWFEVTVIKKFMVCLTHIVFRSDWTWKYVHSIFNCRKDNAVTTLFSFYVQYWCHNNHISHTWGTFYLIHVWIFRSSIWSLFI